MKNPLIGKTVTAVHLAEDGKAIRFDVVESEPIVARADGDCCSVSWIENVEAPERLIGTILSVEDIGEMQPDKEMDSEVIRFYGCKITTAKGECVIDYRNSSNGYYGGNLVWPGEHFYGGVFDQNASTEEWKQIA